MAPSFQWQRATTILLSRRHTSTRYHFLFSTLNVAPAVSSKTSIKSQSSIDETHVLDQISDLFHIPRKAVNCNLCADNSPPPVKPLGFKADDYLAPEDKLRGIFLQKIRGVYAIESALTNVGVNLTLDVFAKVVNRGNLSGEAMVMFFHWVIKQPKIPKDVESYNIIIKALGRRKFFKFMMDMVKEMNLQGVNPNSETLMICFDSYISARQVSKAFQLFKNSEEIGSQCDTGSLNVLLQCSCRRSHVGSAHSLLNSMKGKIPFNLETYNAVISGWSKFGNVGEIERLFKVMVTDGFNPDCTSFAHLLEGLGRAGRIDDAVLIFTSMNEQGCAPDASTYNAMLSNFISIKDFTQCMKYYECMLNNKLEPNMETYKILIVAFLKERKVADALELFDQMLDRGIVPTTGTVTTFIEPLCRYGPPHAAMMIYKKARKSGCIISLTAYKLLLMRLSRFGKCGMIFSIWNEMQESGYMPDAEVYEHVVNGFCNIGQLENAVIVMEESMRKGFCPSRFICSKLSNKLLASHRVDMAYKLFLKIKHARLAENARKYWRSNGWHF